MTNSCLCERTTLLLRHHLGRTHTSNARWRLDIIIGCEVFACRCVNMDCLNVRGVFSVRSLSDGKGVRNELSIGIVISQCMYTL